MLEPLPAVSVITGRSCGASWFLARMGKGGRSWRETVGSDILLPQEMYTLKVSCLGQLKPRSCNLAARLRVALHLQPKYE